MSRVAKNPIVVPQGVEVALGAQEISVKGPLGSISFPNNPSVASSRKAMHFSASLLKALRMLTPFQVRCVPS